MSRWERIMASPLVHVGSGILLAALWIVFAMAHAARFKATGQPSLLFFCLSETVSAWFLLLRTQPKTYSKSPLAWLIAALGTFLPLLFRPNGNALVSGSDWGLIVGVCLQFAGLLSLNRSFAMVPALRELKTGGLYRHVRHPVYASYLVIFTSYVAGNFSTRNLLLWAAVIGLLLMRMRLEERHLGRDPAYREYMARVRWRVLPFIC